MARVVRVKVMENEKGFYHIYSRAAGPKGAYPLSEPEGCVPFTMYKNSPPAKEGWQQS